MVSMKTGFIFLFISLIFCSCMQNKTEDTRDVPVTNNPNIVPSHSAYQFSPSSAFR